MNIYNELNYNHCSISEILQSLGSHFKEYRLRCRLTQKEVAEQAGISLSTVHKFETGALTNISFGNVIRLLRTVGAVENLQNLLPALPENPFLYKNMDFENKKRRVKHKNKQ